MPGIFYEREYFYHVDLHGRLVHDGTTLTDDSFLRFFFKHLRPNDTGSHAGFPFISPCGKEMNFVQAADTPVVFTALREGRLSAPGGIETVFAPASMRFSKGGSLYHPSPIADWARLSSALTLELSGRIEPWGPWYCYRGPDMIHVLEPREAEAKAGLTLLRPKDDHNCFGCGTANPAGLKLSYLYDAQERQSRAWFTPGVESSGAPGWMHGGLISLLFDETMAKVLTGLGVQAATVKLNVTFNHPCRIGHEILLEATLIERDGRKYQLEGTIKEKQRVLAQANAVFVSVERHGG